MTENAPQINPANQGTLRQSIAIADITTEYNLRSGGTIGGVDWEMSASRGTKDGEAQKMGIFLYSTTAKKEADAEIDASFVVRLLGAEPINKSTTHKFTAGGHNWGYIGFLPWSEVSDPSRGFVVDGRVTIEIDVTVEKVNGMMPIEDLSKMKIVDLDDDRFANMIVRVKGEDWQGIRCHKAVICRQSEAIRGAMDHSTKESIDGIFEIGERVATEENVPLLVRLMYEDYKKETMDKHVVELFILADYLLCPRVKQMTLVAMKRLLAVDTFWATLKAAVRIDHKYLVSVCARFAGESFGRLATLLNNEEGKEIGQNVDKEGATALVALMAAIGAQNKK